MTYNGLPVYYIDIEGNIEGEGMDAISIVDYPAVEQNFLTFAAEQPKMKIKFSKDDEKHILTGVAMSANMPIYRCTYDGFEYYTVFTPAAIEKLVVKYSKDNLFNSVNLQHDDDRFVDGIYMIESYFVNKERGIAPKEFDVEDGSYIVSYKVENEELWDMIKNSGEFQGFSIQGWFDLNEEEVFNKQTEKEETFDEWIESFLPEKKKFADNIITVDIAEKAVQNKKKVSVNGVLGQIFAVGKEGKEANIIFQDNNGKWSKIYLDDIKEWEVTGTPISDWNFDDPKWRELIDDEDNIIQETTVTTATTLEDAVKGNYVCMIWYDDEQEGAATGARQCWVSSMGYTTAGNACVRIWEQYGDSRTGVAVNDGWRFLLIRRIMEFRIMTEVQPYQVAPSPLYNGEAKAGSGKNGTMSTVRIKSNL